jgi:hypothetical protein
MSYSTAILVTFEHLQKYFCHVGFTFSFRTLTFRNAKSPSQAVVGALSLGPIIVDMLVRHTAIPSSPPNSLRYGSCESRGPGKTLHLQSTLFGLG